MLKLAQQKVCGDYLQTSAVFLDGWKCTSAINDANDYKGPGTGYRLWEDKDKWNRLENVPWALDPQKLEF